MINPKEYLAMDDKTFAVEIARVLTPGPWKHINKKPISVQFQNPPIREKIYYCSKCGEIFQRDNRKMKIPCPIPDPITLDWNLAMKIFRDAEKQHSDINWKMEVCNAAKGYILAPHEAHAPTTMMWIWFCVEAQPRHYILAAAIVLEGD